MRWFYHAPYFFDIPTELYVFLLVPVMEQTCTLIMEPIIVPGKRLIDGHLYTTLLQCLASFQPFVSLASYVRIVFA